MTLIHEEPQDEISRKLKLFNLRSTATNAYDLCMDAAAAIEEEPKRYDQNVWVDRVIDRDNPKEEASRYPACGTVGCRAGWIVELAGRGAGGGTVHIEGAAHDILDTSVEKGVWDEFDGDVDNLFIGGALSYELTDEELSVEDGIRPGTHEYAFYGARGLRRFAEKWKERLLNTPVHRGDTEGDPHRRGGER